MPTTKANGVASPIVATSDCRIKITPAVGAMCVTPCMTTPVSDKAP